MRKYSHIHLYPQTIRYRIPILLSILSLVFLNQISRIDIASSERIIISSLLLALPLWSILFHRQFINSIQSLSKIVLPLSALVVAVIILNRPQLADYLAREDGLVETMSATFLFIGSALMLSASIIMLRSKYKLAATLACILSIIFFVICMEEISWGQRILNIATPSLIEAMNDQGEFNLHNIATGATEKIYYLGAFILLTLAPLIRNGCIRVLSALNLPSLSVLVPSVYLLYPFIIVNAFIKNEPDTFLFIGSLVASIIILLYRLFKAAEKSNEVLYIILSLIVMVICSAVAYTVDHSLHGTRPWFLSEYREFYIAIGIMFYAFYVVRSVASQKTANT